MLEVKWEYLENNICSDKPVAILKSISFTHEPILYVYEGRDHHYCIVSPQYSFFSPKQVNYCVESENVIKNNDATLVESLSLDDVLVLRLKEGCKIIKKDIIDQVKTILQLIS